VRPPPPAPPPPELLDESVDEPPEPELVDPPEPELVEPPEPKLVDEPPDPEVTAALSDPELLSDPPDPLEDPMVEAWNLLGLLRCVDSRGLRLGSMPKSLTALMFWFKSPSAFWSSSVAVTGIREVPTPSGTVVSRAGESSKVNR
jgi:hypothetical protein